MKKIEKDKNGVRRIVDMERVVVYGSLGLAVLIGLVMLFPMTNNSHATTEDEFSGKVHADVKTYVRSTIALAVSGQVNLDLTPRASGTFSEAAAKLSVSTNNVSGYSVYLAMADSNSNSLLPMNTRSVEEIKATPAMLTAENYADYLNTWGYMIGKGVGYKAVPKTANAPIITEGVNVKEMSYDLSFAVAVGTDLPAGVYGNQVLISAVANPIEVRGINDITFMQEMTSDICAVSFENETKQLIDTRDGKSYWVAKLRDGNCWMIQNLALDLSTTKTLTAADTDVSADWTPISNTNEIAVDGIKNSSAADNQYSWNMGKIVSATPLLSQVCGYRGGVNSAKSGDDLGTVCRSVGFVDVSSSEWNSDYNAQAGFFNDVSQPLVAVDENNHTYDAHYLIGNYYQYGAATAGSGASIVSANQAASGSICPKGWKLPTAGKYLSGDLLNRPIDWSGSFYNLFLAYGYPENMEYKINQYGHAYTSVLTGDDQDLNSVPMYFVRAGYVNLADNYLQRLGSNGYYWSSTSSSKEHAYYLDYSSSIISPSLNFQRYFGESVRCLAK